MTNRFQLKQFAGKANNNGQFGSYQTGTKVLTNNPEEIQELEAWNNGWTSATTQATILPRLEEMQGLQYTLCKSIKELYSEGIPVWLAAETYYINSFCQYDGKIYKNITGNNSTNNPLLDIDNWVPLQIDGGAGLLPGQLITSTTPLADAELHLADGTTLPSTGIYSDFYNYMTIVYNNTPDKTFYQYVNNYTTVGTPTIDKNYYVSNITTTNYIKSNRNVFFDTTKPWSIEVAVDYTTVNNGSSWICLSNETNNNGIFIETSYTNLAVFMSSNGTSWDLANGTIISALTINKKYCIKAEYIGTAYNFYLKELDQEYSITPTYSLVNATPINIGDTTATIKLGVNNNGSHWFSNGSIILADTETNTSFINLVVDGNKVWSAINISIYNSKQHTFCSEEEYNNDIINTGNCGKYVWSETDIRLPTIDNNLIEHINTINNNGKIDSIGNGLVIDVTTQTSITNDAIITEDGYVLFGVGGEYYSISLNGIMVYNGGRAGNYTEPQTAILPVKKGDVITFSGNIGFARFYKGTKNTTINNTIKYLTYIVIGTVTKTDIEVDIDKIAVDLNNKLDKDCNNLSSTGITTLSNTFTPTPTLELNKLGQMYNISNVNIKPTIPEGGSWFYIALTSNAHISAQYVYSCFSSGIAAGGSVVNPDCTSGNPHYSLMAWRIQ